MEISISFPEGKSGKRINKGKSIIEFPESFVMVDLETTGLYPGYDEIIEIAALRISNGEVQDSFQQLVRPEWEITDFITELTGITNEMLIDQPEIDTVLPRFLDFLGDSTVMGYNVSFDVNFLYDNCENLNLPHFSNNYIDVMRIAKKLYPDLPHHRLSDMKTLLDVKSDVSHRALEDCLSTLDCYKIMQNVLLEKYSTYDDFIKLFSRNHYQVKAKDLHATTAEFDEENPFFQKVCVFTGALEKMTRKDAMQLVLNLGGLCGDNVTKKTNYLILGNNDYRLKGEKSSKQKKAEDLKLKGSAIEIIPESVFYDILNEYSL